MTSPTRPRPAGGALSGRVAKGLAWLIARTALTKVLTIVGQMILARILLPDDFGLFAVCVIATAIANTVGEAGVKQVLVQRYRRLSLWTGPAFWMSLVTGALAWLSTVALIPVLASAYGPAVTPLLLVLSIESLTRPLTLVPMARLQVDMRFGAIATIGLMQSVVHMGVQIGLAAGGLGALALAASRPVMTIFGVVALWAVSRQKPGGPIRLSRWKYLFGGTMWLLAGSALWKVTQQADKAILGAFASPAQVGLYYVAFTVSMQTIMLVTQNLQNVLLPVFSSIKGDLERQRSAAERGAGVLAAVTLPVCVSVSIVSFDVMPIAFGATFAGAGPILAVLVIAIFFRSVTPVFGTLMQGQARFRDAFLAHLFSVLVFVPVVVFGSRMFGAIGAAWALVAHAAIAQLISARLLFGDQGAFSALRAVRWPVICAVVPGVLSHIFVRRVAGDGSYAGLITSCAIAVAFASAYGLSLYHVERSVFLSAWKPVHANAPVPVKAVLEQLMPGLATSPRVKDPRRA